MARRAQYPLGFGASGAEVRAAIYKGLPVLRRAAQAERRSDALEARLKWLETWTPAP